MFEVTLALFSVSAVCALLFYRSKPIANALSNIGCMLGAFTGAIYALVQILKGSSITLFEHIMPVPYISLLVGIDSVSAFFMLILCVLVFAVSIYSIGYMKKYFEDKPTWVFNFLYPIFIIAVLFVFLAKNTVMFLIAWEIMSLLSYFLIAFEADKKEARDASTLYIVMTHLGTAAIFFAFIVMYVVTGSFDMVNLSGILSANVKLILFILLLIGFGTKAGAVPMHIWLPYAHPAAPANVSALLSGVMIKTAIFGMIRFFFEVLGIQSIWWGITILILGIISTVFGVVYAFVEKNIKKLLAFSSIENIGIILMGVGMSMIGVSIDSPMLMALGLTAAMVHTFNHAMFKGLLFMCAGSVDYATHTKNMEELGGLMKKMPFTGLFTLIGALSITAIIPFNGFIGEWLTLQAFFSGVGVGNHILNVVIVIAVASLGGAGAMAVGAYIKVMGISFLGSPRTEKAEKAVEVPGEMLFAKLILAVICLGVGVYPALLVGLVDRAFVGISSASVLQEGGRWFVLWYPITQGNAYVMPIVPIMLVVGVILGMLVIRWVFSAKTSIRKYGTWDCGFVSLDSRMQYSATGLSKPLAMLLRFVYRTYRNIQVKVGKTPYNILEIRYNAGIEHIIEKYIYRPIIRTMTRKSHKFRFSFQTGSIHLYLLYIFVAIFVLLLYNRLV